MLLAAHVTLVLVGKVARLTATQHYLSLSNPVEQGLVEAYPTLPLAGIMVLGTILKVYGETGTRAVLEPNRPVALPVVKTEYGFGLDVSQFTMAEGVPIGYYLEVVVTHYAHGPDRRPLFPGELKLRFELATPAGLRKQVEEDIDAIRRVAQAYQAIELLAQRGLGPVANDLQEGLVRLQRDDYEGAVFSFRKTVEALKNAVGKTHRIRDSDGRTEAMREHLAKSYHLLSAFGAHAGTSGLREEAMFAKEIAVSAATYFALTAKGVEVPRTVDTSA